MVPQRNDQVFQLSLTEIAFTISFILLLLLGFLVLSEQGKRKEAEAALAETLGAANAAEALARARADLERGKAEFASAMAATIPNPEEIITRLVQASTNAHEGEQLKRRIADLESQISAMTALKAVLDDAASERDAARETIEQALTLQEEIRRAFRQPHLAAASQTASSGPESAPAAASIPAPSPPAAPTSLDPAKQGNNAMGDVKNEPPKGSPPPQLPVPGDAQLVARARQAIAMGEPMRQQYRERFGREVTPGEEAKVARDLAEAAMRYAQLGTAGAKPEAMRKENSDLRGQVEFFKKRLEARGGRDFPPCWADETGKVEFLFAVELRADTVALAQAWPERRTADAQTLPGIDEALATPHTYAAFPGRIGAIFEQSKRQNPQCRHYVQLRSNIADAVQSDRARLMVERYFYKVEARR